MKPLAVVLLMVAVTTAAAGQEKKWSVKHLKKTDPDSLNVVVWPTDDCPGTKETYERVVDGELLRARIKRTPTWRPYEVRLQAILECRRISDRTAFIYRTSVRFFAMYPVLDSAPDEEDYYVVHYADGFVIGRGAFGFLPGYNSDKIERVLKTGLRDAVSDALTDYLRANFTE